MVSIFNRRFLGSKSIAMRNIRNLSRIKTLIRRSGIVLKNAPSIDHPIPVAVFYRNNPDGTVHGFWPKGNRETAFSALTRRSSRVITWTLRVYSLFLALGLEGWLAHGRLVVYTDLPTATYLQQQWRSH